MLIILISLEVVRWTTGPPSFWISMVILLCSVILPEAHGKLLQVLDGESVELVSLADLLQLLLNVGREAWPD